MEERRRDCKESGGVEPSKVEEIELRRGPWSMEEDIKLVNFIAHNGEGRWNFLTRCAGLKRIGKSCRLRWLNYLRPDVRRGNITLEEQLLILELHSRWGNRWSKIAQHLPGRTDNEIKNYWRTRVLKHAKQRKCDVNSKLFNDTIQNLCMPRLVEQHLQAQSKSQIQPSSSTSDSLTTQFSPIYDLTDICDIPVKNDLNRESNSIQNNNILTTDNLHQGYFQTSYDIPFSSPSSLSNNQSFELADDNLDCIWNIDDSWYSFSQDDLNNIL